MDTSLQALWTSMNWSAKTVVVVMLIMSVYSIWVMVERFITFQQAKNQSLKLLGALSNVLTKGDYQQAIDITKKYKDSHLAKVISAGLLEFEAARRDRRNTDPEVPIEAARQQNEDLARMFEWFDRVGYDVHIRSRSRECGIPPTRLASWAASRPATP